MSKIIRVDREQIASARALVEISGGLDKVDPLIRKIATAEPAKRSTSGDRKAS